MMRKGGRDSPRSSRLKVIGVLFDELVGPEMR